MKRLDEILLTFRMASELRGLSDIELAAPASRKAAYGAYVDALSPEDFSPLDAAALRAEQRRREVAKQSAAKAA